MENNKNYTYNAKFKNFFIVIIVLYILFFIYEFFNNSSKNFFNEHLVGIVLFVNILIFGFADKKIYKSLGLEDVELSSSSIYIKIRTLFSKQTSAKEIKICKITSLKKVNLYDEYGLEVKYIDENGDKSKQVISALNCGYKFVLQLCDSLEKFNFQFDKQIIQLRNRVKSIDNNYGSEKNKRKMLRTVAWLLYSLINFSLLYLFLEIIYFIVFYKFDFLHNFKTFFLGKHTLIQYMVFAGIALIPTMKYPYDLDVN